MKIRETLTKMRVCIMEATKHNIPFCCAMNRREYEKKKKELKKKRKKKQKDKENH